MKKDFNILIILSCKRIALPSKWKLIVQKVREDSIQTIP